MPFLGSTPADQYQSLAKQTITGDGSTAYTLNRSVTNAYDMEVFINNVRQEPDTSYTASGNTITFTTAVNSSDSCYIIFQGKSVGSINPPANSVGGSQIQNTSVTAAHMHTAAGVITKSNDAPSNPSNGDFWYDLNDFSFKFYDGTNWNLIKNAFGATGGTVVTTDGYRYHTFTSSGTFSVTKGVADIEYLVVAGGGGSTGRYGGGGGAGGLLQGTAASVSSDVTITIGGGGAAGPNGPGSARGDSGTNTTLTGGISLTAIGGGAGGATDSNQTGLNGGSGGGGSNGSAGGSGTSGQGNAGGAGFGSGYTYSYKSGGGGGAGAVGANGDPNGSNGPGNGGDGRQFSDWATATSTGDSGYYAGGGSGGGHNPFATTGVRNPGGAGGGGDSGIMGSTGPGTDGQVNTGGGGGGYTTTGGNSSGSGGAGGSGIVILRYQV